MCTAAITVCHPAVLHAEMSRLLEVAEAAATMTADDGPAAKSGRGRLHSLEATGVTLRRCFCHRLGGRLVAYTRLDLELRSWPAIKRLSTP